MAKKGGAVRLWHEARESSWSWSTFSGRRAEKVKPQKQKEAASCGHHRGFGLISVGLQLDSGGFGLNECLKSDFEAPEQVDELLERQRWERRAQELGRGGLLA